MVRKTSHSIKAPNDEGSDGLTIKLASDDAESESVFHDSNEKDLFRVSARVVESIEGT